MLEQPWRVLVRGSRCLDFEALCQPAPGKPADQKKVIFKISSVTCSTPVLSLALVSTKIMLYLFVEHKNRHKRKMINNFESYLSNEEKNLSAHSFASCTPTFLRPPRSHLLPTFNKLNFLLNGMMNNQWSHKGTTLPRGYQKPAATHQKFHSLVTIVSLLLLQPTTDLDLE